MKYQFARFAEFLRTPFPYLFLALCLFLASTLLGNAGFRESFQTNSTNAGAASTEKYELCLVCSGPGAKDQLSELGFTVANFVLIPVTFATLMIMGLIAKVATVSSTMVYAVYLAASLLYGILLPFGIFAAYEKLDTTISARTGNDSVYTG